MSYVVPFIRRFVPGLFAVAACLSVHNLAVADASSASLLVTLTDSSGAMVPDADVTLRNSDTNQDQHVSSQKAGIAAFPFVKPGHYELIVMKMGFADVSVSNIELNVGDNRRIQLILKIGPTAQTVNVDGSGVTLNTSDGSVGTVIDRRFVENIPLNGRSFQDLISMTPGVLTQSPQASSSIGSNGDFSVNGQRTESNYYMVDGVSGNVNPGNGQAGVGGNGTIGASTALGTTQSLISVDALQEFRVSSSSYAAEFGHSPGGQFSFVSRSGTNTIHGSAFDYLRNSFFDANDWFNDNLGEPLAPLRQNDFGGTLGGPIRFPWIYNGKDKSFFFVSYEGLRLAQPQAAAIQYVPDASLRSSADPILQPFLNAFPVQNGKEETLPCTGDTTTTYPCPSGSPVGTLVQSGLADFSKSYSLPSTINSTSIRVDHTFGSKLTAFFRFGDTPSSQSSRSLSQFTQTEINSHNYTLGATSQLSSTVTNEVRLGYASNDSRILQSLDGFGGATPTNMTAQEGIPASANASTLFLLYFPGVGLTDLNVQATSNGVRNWDLIDTTTVLRGSHQMKFGVEYTQLKSIEDGFTTAVYPYYFSPSALQNNQATFLTAQQNANATPVAYTTDAYAQDEWKMASRISLSYGIRWEVEPAPHDQHDNDAYTILGTVSDPATLTLAPRGTSLWNTYWYNFVPRFGLAWRAHGEPGKETVIRTGVGAFSDTYGEAMFLGFSALGFSASQTYFGSSLPVTPAQLDFTPAAAPPYTTGGIYAFPRHLQVPYTLEWNTSVEQALGNNQTFSLTYVGSNGRRLISAQQLSLNQLNSNFGSIYIFPANITSNYQALQTKFQRTVGHGIQALASYTWSHAIDYGSTYTTFAATRGNADFDVRQNLSGGLSWDIPGASAQRIVAAFLDHWALDGRLVVRSSFPITLSGNSLTDPTTGNLYYSGVNLVPGKPLYLYGPQYPGGRALNGGPNVSASDAAFTLPNGTDDGNAPRNSVRGFGENQINLAVRRTFPIKDTASLQFRAETFNLLNHPNFGYIDPSLNDALFGQATRMLNESLGTIASQYQQGGPRSMQFALRLSF